MSAQCKMFRAAIGQVETQMNWFLREKKLSRDQVQITMATEKATGIGNMVLVALLYDEVPSTQEGG